MGTKKNERLILIDADVLSHFISGGQITLLPHIFPYPIKILDKVYAEISRMPGRKTEVDNLINFKLIEQIPFPEDNPDIRKELDYPEHIDPLIPEQFQKEKVPSGASFD